MTAKGFHGLNFCHNDHDYPLKTATALSDPVLIRLSNASGHTLILAEVAYNHAGEIHLDHVRFFRTRRGLRSVLPTRTKSSGCLSNLTLQTSKDYIAARIPTQPYVRVASKLPHFAMKHLTREQSMLLRASSQRRFATMAFQLTPVPSRRLSLARSASSHYSARRLVRAATGYAALAGGFKRLALAFARN